MQGYEGRFPSLEQSAKNLPRLSAGVEWRDASRVGLLALGGTTVVKGRSVNNQAGMNHVAVYMHPTSVSSHCVYNLKIFYNDVIQRPLEWQADSYRMTLGINDLRTEAQCRQTAMGWRQQP